MLAQAASLIETQGAPALIVAALAFFTGGFVKGATGFGLPLVAVAGSTLALPASVAVPLVALPALVTNVWQAFRFGWRAAWRTLREFALLYAVLAVTVFLTARLVAGIDERTFFALLGLGVSGFSILQLIGWRPQIPPQARTRTEIVAGLVGGVFGGLAGVWGPAIVMVMLALRLPKQEHVRACGIGMGLGSVPFIIGHASTGLLDGGALIWSAAMLLPSLAGMRLGIVMQDRLDAEAFRRWTLIVLVLAGFNLLRRASFG